MLPETKERVFSGSVQCVDEAAAFRPLPIILNNNIEKISSIVVSESGGGCPFISQSFKTSLWRRIQSIYSSGESVARTKVFWFENDQFDLSYCENNRIQMGSKFNHNQCTILRICLSCICVWWHIKCRFCNSICCVWWSLITWEYQRYERIIMKVLHELLQTKMLIKNVFLGKLVIFNFCSWYAF